MITFKHYLIEVFTNPYPHRKTSHGCYSFKTPNDEYEVSFSFDHYKNNGEVNVCFDSKKHGFHSINNEARGQSHRVFSTIHNIMKTHLADNPHIKTITFDAWNKYPSRVKLYDKLLSTFTKKHTREGNDNEMGNTYFSFHRDDIRENLEITSVLVEELVPKVYHNISPRTLMNLSKEHGHTRFVIDGDDRIHAGAAHDFIHSNLYPKDVEFSDYRKNLKFAGAVMSYDKETGKHHFGGYNHPDHPIIDKLKEYGAIHGKRVGDWGDLKAVENKYSEDSSPKFDKKEVSSLARGLRSDATERT